MGDRRPSGPLTEDPVFEWLYIDDDEADPDEEVVQVVIEVEEPDERELPWGTYVAPRHLPGQHDQKTHGHGHGSGKVGGMVKGTDQTEWAASQTRNGRDETGLNDMGELSDPRDLLLMTIGKQQGFDGKPTKVTSIEDTVAAGGVEIWRGSAKDTNAKLIDGPYEPGTGLYGNGYYFSNKQRVAEHFSKLDIQGSRFSDTVARRADGTVVRAALKPGAKVVDYDQVKAEMQAWRKEVRPKTMDVADLYEADFQTPKDMYSPHLVDTVANDPGRFAAMKGYDAIKVVGYQDGAPVKKGEPTAKHPETGARFSANDQYIILNRTALVVEPVVEKPKGKKMLKLKDANGNVLDEVDITGMEE